MVPVIPIIVAWIFSFTVFLLTWAKIKLDLNISATLLNLCIEDLWPWENIIWIYNCIVMCMGKLQYSTFSDWIRKIFNTRLVFQIWFFCGSKPQPTTLESYLTGSWSVMKRWISLAARLIKVSSSAGSRLEISLNHFFYIIITV